MESYLWYVQRNISSRIKAGLCVYKCAYAYEYVLFDW